MEKVHLSWQSIGHLLEESVSRFGSKTLFTHGGKSLSFYETNRRVNQLANALIGLDVNKGNRVAVMLPNCFEFPISWLAIAKLGAVMVPVNINYRAHDLQYVLSDSGASTILIHVDYLPLLKSVLATLPEIKRVIVLGGTLSDSEFYDYESLLTSASSDYFVGDIQQTDLLNIQYSSGTTGFPKGCMLTHSYWMLLGKVAHDYIQVVPEDVDLTVQPFYYMDPQWNTVLCLIGGIPLVILPRFSPTHFWHEVKKNKVTFIYILGTMPCYLMKLPEDPDLEQNHHLRLVVCSGIPSNFHSMFEKRWKTPWREAYGSTESGVDLLVPTIDADSVGSGAMGLPIPTKQAIVVDTEGKELPNGEIGEMWVKGEPMMLGYWNQMEATAKTMHLGWFHTGDLVYKDAKTYFHWVGRLKDIIRRSGENISASEVESVLIEHPRLNAVAVISVPDQLRGEEVKAYLVLKEGETPQTLPPEEFLDFTKQRLAYFKVPRYWEYVKDLPYTPSERVEKHKLIIAKSDLRLDSYDTVDGIWR
ncbi:MAG: AMP-binding protein [Chloroflexi bacterium]|nr:AMP-binding protein [Chloroflexota bacterium]